MTQVLSKSAGLAIFLRENHTKTSESREKLFALKALDRFCKSEFGIIEKLGEVHSELPHHF